MRGLLFKIFHCVLQVIILFNKKSTNAWLTGCKKKKMNLNVCIFKYQPPLSIQKWFEDYWLYLKVIFLLSFFTEWEIYWLLAEIIYICLYYNLIIFVYYYLPILLLEYESSEWLKRLATSVKNIRVDGWQADSVELAVQMLDRFRGTHDIFLVTDYDSW